MVAVSLTINQSLYSETDTSTLKEIDETWLLEDGTAGLNLYPYDAGSYEIYFPFNVVILSDSDGRWLFSTYYAQEEEIERWKESVNTEVNLHNETIKDFNALRKQYERNSLIMRYGIPSGIILGLITGLIIGG
jgi:hypothetical protein